MKATNGNVIIRVNKSVHELSINGLLQDVRFDKHRKTWISGIVEITPEVGGNEGKDIIWEEYEGMPRRKNGAVYHRASEYPCLIPVGSKVYFHYLALEQDHNFIDSEGRDFIYRVALDTIFCWVEDGKIHMNYNFVLGTPYWGEDVEDLGNGQRGKTKLIEGLAKPLVTEIIFKPQVDFAYIKHIGPGIYQQRNVVPDDLVLLTPACEFDNVIEDKEYWVFKHEDIMAVKRGEFIVPVADYVMIQTDKPLYKTSLIVPDTVSLELPFTGTVVAFGESADVYGQGLKRGMRVAFHKRDMRMLMANLVLIRSGNIQFEIQ